MGFDSAGWGILGGDVFFPVYAKTKVDFATSMTPTYNDKSDDTNRAFARQEMSYFGANRSGLGCEFECYYRQDRF